MSLSEISIPSKTISVGEKDFTVWPVSVEVLSNLLSKHSDEMETIFVSLDSGGKEGNLDFAMLANSLLQKFPGFTASLIAAAAGEPEASPKVARLSLPTQLEALMSIIDMTVGASGGLKKSLDLISEAMMMATNVMKDLTPEDPTIN